MISHIIERLYQLSIKHWFITALLLTLPTFWFALIKFIGNKAGFVDSSGRLTLIGIIISIILFAIILLFAIMKSYKDNLNNQSNYNNLFLLQKILSSLNSVCSKETFRFLEYIKENSLKRKLHPFNEITQPKKQIADLLEEIRICLSEILGINRDNISISILYKYCINGIERDLEKWDWFYTTNIGGLTIEEILKNPRSSAIQIINGKVDYIFYADKKDGIKDLCYVSDKKDEIHNNIGSVICKKINIETDDSKYVFAVLNISTYGSQVCDSNDDKSKNTILSIVLPHFEERIRFELSLAYIKYVLS